MTPLIGLAIAGGVLGLAKGWGNARARKAEFEDKKQDLERQEEALDDNYSQAKESYNLATDQTKAVAEATKTEYNLLADETEANRDTTLEQTSTTGSAQSHINAMQLATLSVQAEQAEGSANQAVATSGFRTSGTAGNLVANAKSSNADTISQAKMQAKLADSQTFNQAVNNYTSANQQIAAYQRKVEQTESQLQMDLDSLDLQMEQTTENYNREGGYLTDDIDYMESDKAKNALWWAQAGDIVGGAFDGAASIYSSFK